MARGQARTPARLLGGPEVVGIVANLDARQCRQLTQQLAVEAVGGSTQLDRQLTRYVWADGKRQLEIRAAVRTPHRRAAGRKHEPHEHPVVARPHLYEVLQVRDGPGFGVVASDLDV
jgi:hypothetical protein